LYLIGLDIYLFYTKIDCWQANHKAVRNKFPF
jgi:hypothetical protein